jgi:ferredoxin
MMHVTVDHDLCQGHGVCESEVPAVFKVGRDHKVVVLSEHPSEGLRSQMDEAVRYCPTSALTITG